MNKLAKPPRSRPQPRDDVVQLAIRIGLLGILIYWSFLLVRPFIPIVVWSLVLTVALYPVYAWFTERLGGRRIIAAVMVTILSLVIVIGPATWLALSLIDGLRAVAEKLNAGGLAVPAPPRGVKDWPLIGNQIYENWDLASTNLGIAMEQLRPHLRPYAGPLLGAAADAGTGILKFLLSIALMGYLFLPAPRMANGVRVFLKHVVPARSDEFVALAGATIRTISRGVLGIAVLQSLLAGIGFQVAGVPGAGLLAFIALFFGIVQIGVGVVVLGVLVWAWMTMDATTALLFTVYMVPVALLDNFLKPVFMGHGLKTPMLVILIGVLGGTLAHGIIGLFVGPIILAVGWELLVAWTREEPVINGAGMRDAEKRTPSAD